MIRKDIIEDLAYCYKHYKITVEVFLHSLDFILLLSDSFLEDITDYRHNPNCTYSIEWENEDSGDYLDLEIGNVTCTYISRIKGEELGKDNVTVDNITEIKELLSKLIHE